MIGGMGETIINQLIWAGGVIIVMIIVAAGIWLGLQLLKFNTKVVIISKRGNKGKILFDKGGYFKRKDGSVLFRLLKQRAKIEPPNYEYLIPSIAGNTLFLYQQDFDKFYPISPQVLEGNPSYKLGFKSQDYDVDLWAANMMQLTRLQFQKQNFFEKYGNYIFFATIAMIVVVMIAVILKEIGNVTGGLSATAKQLTLALANNQQTAATPPAPPNW